MSESLHQLRATGERLMREGRFEDAATAHEQLLALDPSRADSWFNLGWLRRQLRSYDQALEAYGQALDRGGRGPEEIRLNRAVILSEHLERADEAEAELRLALEANPRFTLAWLNLGNLLEDRGDAEAAREAYERVLAIRPDIGRALARLAAIDLFEGTPARAIARLEPAIANPSLQAEDRAEILFALGNALDAAGRYEEAFAAFESANRLGRALLPRGGEYDPAAAEQLIDKLIATFAEPAKQSPASGEGKAPLFICGMFRSGSTLAEQILARHSAVTSGGELETLPALVAERLQPYPEAVATASPSDLAAIYRREVEVLHPQAGILTDKRCDNFLHIGLIKTMFPDARIIHTRRDPLDNLLSIHCLYFGDGVGYGFDLADSLHWYRQYRRLMDHWRALYGDDIFDLDYEALVSEPRATVERLLAFCNLPWEEACLSQAAGARPVRTASVWQVRQPLHANSAGRWRNYETQLASLSAELAASGLRRD